MAEYVDNHLSFPEFIFYFDTEKEIIMTEGTFNTSEGIYVGEKTEIGPDMYKGLAFWSRPSDDKSPHIHIDDWSDSFSIPHGYSSHEDVAFFEMTNAELLETGKMDEPYIEDVQTRLEEKGSQPVITGPYLCC